MLTKIITSNTLWTPKGPKFLMVLQAEQVLQVEDWDWLGTHKKIVCHKYSLTLWSHPYGNYFAAYNKFFVEFTCCVWALFVYKKNSKNPKLCDMFWVLQTMLLSPIQIINCAVIQHGVGMHLSVNFCQLGTWDWLYKRSHFTDIHTLLPYLKKLKTSCQLSTLKCDWKHKNFGKTQSHFSRVTRNKQ